MLRVNRAAAPLVLEPGQRELLESLARSRTAQHRLVQRARVLLYAAEGMSNSDNAALVGVSRMTVRAWRSEFAERGLADLGKVAAGRGRKASIPQATIDKIVELTLHARPEGATHWSCRSMAAKVGVSAATVQRVWDARGLKPHLVETFKLSNDKRFEEKLVDVVGLYLNPPDKAVVLCMDEKSQIQALDRTQPSLPLKPGRAGTMTHDYKRHGTTTLFAALDVLTGKVIGKCFARHRHDEFLRFLRTIDTSVPRKLQIHMIVDNYGTHTHPNVKTWLAKHPRFHLHFTPTSSSWLNLVERWFADLTDKMIRRGVFHSVPDLVKAIEEYLRVHNDDPKPFVWTATAESILTKVRRGRVALQQAASQN
ncbi:IS630 family transposase [Salinispora mooreana]|uniref:IS630 family transposase n=1 Tax=Salinispora mooreana TaxID=999545 RepID=UPI0005350532